jgi:hypothetical protein
VSGAKARVESLSHREYGHADDVIHRGHASARSYGEAICMYVHMPTPDRRRNLNAKQPVRIRPDSRRTPRQYECQLW